MNKLSFPEGEELNGKPELEAAHDITQHLDKLEIQAFDGDVDLSWLTKKCDRELSWFQAAGKLATAYQQVADSITPDITDADRNQRYAKQRLLFRVNALRTAHEDSGLAMMKRNILAGEIPSL